MAGKEEQLTPFSESQLEIEFTELHEDPRSFVKTYDGQRPYVAEYLNIPPGFIIDGVILQDKEWQAIKRTVVPSRPDDSESIPALNARLEIARLKEIISSPFLSLSVIGDEKENFVSGGWTFRHVILPDLGRSISDLKEEAIEAERSGDLEKAGMRFAAILVQTPTPQPELLALWTEIFVKSHK